MYTNYQEQHVRLKYNVNSFPIFVFSHTIINTPSNFCTCIIVTAPKKKPRSSRQPSNGPSGALSASVQRSDEPLQGTDDEFLSSSDDDDDDDDEPTSNDPNFVWYGDERLEHPFPPVLPTPQPVTFPRGRCPAWKVFMAFFTTPLIAKICKETNVAGKERVDRTNAKFNRDTTWVSVTAEEMYVFLGVCIAMSVSPKGDQRSHFAQESKGGYVPQNLGRFMKQTRFNDIKLALRFNDASLDLPHDHPDHDKLYKLRPVLDCLNAQSKANMTMSGLLAGDEFMVSAYHRTYLRQYMPNKPDQYGIKGWGLCDSISGYMYDHEIYSGKRPGEAPTKNLGQRVVEGLVSRSEAPKGSIIAMDRFFTSPTLVRSLLDQGIHAIGSCNPNRKGWPTGCNFSPSEYKTSAQKKELRGQVRYAVTNDKKMLALCWFDNKPVYMLGTCFQPDGCVVMRKQVEANGKKSKVRINFPQLIDQYNHLMGGVDINDGQRKVRNLVTSVGTKKWTVRLFMGLMSIAVNNSCILFNAIHDSTKKMPIAQFIIQLQHGLFRQFKPDFLELSWKPTSSSSSPDVASPEMSPPVASRRRVLQAPAVVDHDVSQLTASVMTTKESDTSVYTPGSSNHVCKPNNHTYNRYTKKNRTVNGVNKAYVTCTKATKLFDCVVCCTRRESNTRSKKNKRTRNGARTTMICVECQVSICNPMKNRTCWDKYHAGAPA